MTKKEVIKKMLDENQETLYKQTIIKEFLEALVKDGDLYQIDGTPRDAIIQRAGKNIKEVKKMVDYLKGLIKK